MALFSDMDWVIIAAVGVFLLFGNGNTGMMRTLGHWYGRVIHLKQQLMTEVTKSADIPLPLSGQPISLRAAFFGMDSATTGRVSGIPAVVSNPPGIPYRPVIPPDLPWASGTPTPTWSVALPAVGIEPEGPR